MVTPKRREFIAKFVADIAKAIFAIGLASHFFKEFVPAVRIILVSTFAVLTLVSFITEPAKRGE